MSLVADIYLLTKKLPDEEKFGLISQLRRCSVPIPSNIAEGTSRPSQKEFKYFLRISLGSSFELETQLLLVNELGFIKTEEFSTTIQKIKELQKMIIGFEKSLDNPKSKNLSSKI